jgi:hypothetical protein
MARLIEARGRDVPHTRLPPPATGGRRVAVDNAVDTARAAPADPPRRGRPNVATL